MALHTSTDDPRSLLEPLRRLHLMIRRAVVEACERSALETMSAIAREEEGDTIYAVDCISEELLIEFFEREVAPTSPLVLVAEGLPQGQVVLPVDAKEADTVWRIIVDPIDGTRGLMYQKRSGWILTGVAPNRGADTCLTDISLALQTEIPLVKQHLCDVAWAVRGEGAHALRVNRLTGEQMPLVLRPSQEPSIAHGYAQVSRFFPGARAELAAIDEEIVMGILGPVRQGKAHCFEDQYASSGGQLYELACGHDRFIADLRPLMEESLRARGLALGICCHPYDICTELIAREAGVLVTGPDGGPLRARLSVEPDVAWVGYANAGVRAQVEPVLRAALARRGLLREDEAEGSTPHV
jgi:fructose-1,6-bisphosphatase/inositol monophosphatase family enzyme